jgi:hypothetical protein
MVIKCNLQGGFGNHMMTYMLACILAVKFNMQIELNSNSIANDKLYQRYDTRNTIFSVVNNDFICKTGNIKTKLSVNSVSEYLHLLKREYICENITLRIIHIDDMSFFKKNIHNIIHFFNFPALSTDLSRLVTNDKTIVLSLRLGMGENEESPNVFQKDLRLPFTYYKKAIYNVLEKHEIDNIIICSDNFKDNYLENLNEFRDYNIIYLNSNTLEQFLVIINAKFFISSNSSFSIIASLFNESGNIYFPKFKKSNSMYPGSINQRYNKILYPYSVNNEYIEID